MMKKTVTEAPPIRIREATEQDVNFIFSSWLKSYRDSSFAKSITNTVYFHEHHKLIEELLKTCKVLVACDNNNIGDIFGYTVTEEIEGQFVTHFSYVKHTYRNLGIAKALFKEAGADFTKLSLYTHSTKNSDRFAEKYNLVHSPYIAFMKQYRVKEHVEAKDESDSN